MGLMRTRSGGVWVDTDQAGYARLNNAWTDYGPDDTPATYEALSWPNPTPNLIDQSDGPNAYYNLGMKFRINAAKLCYGVQWRVPFTSPDPTPYVHTAALWLRVTETRLAVKQFTPTPNQYQDILFDTPVMLDAAPEEYVVSVFSWHYVHRAPVPSEDWIIYSPSGNILGYQGRLSEGNPDAFPSSAFNALYYVSPIVGT
jgi:hypothetical protein